MSLLTLSATTDKKCFFVDISESTDKIKGTSCDTRMSFICQSGKFRVIKHKNYEMICARNKIHLKLFRNPVKTITSNDRKTSVNGL